MTDITPEQRPTTLPDPDKGEILTILETLAAMTAMNQLIAGVRDE